MATFLPQYSFEDVAEGLTADFGAPSNHVDPPSGRFLDAFFDPAMRYTALVTTTGLHWGGLQRHGGPSRTSEILRVMLTHFADEFERRALPNQQVYLRASMPSERQCFARTTRPLRRLTAPEKMGFVLKFNIVLEEVARSRFRWLGLERLSRLRPDAHDLDGCLHFPTGSGVVEAWSDLLFHQLFSERPLG